MESIIGQKFNRLTVLKETDKRTKQRTKIFLCRCECGNLKEVAREKLRHGTKSCGCLKLENLAKKYGKEHRNWSGEGEVSKSFFTRIKNSASQKSYEFSLTIHDLWDLFLKQNRKCALTGQSIELPINIRKLRDKSDQRLASLDRIDNDKGYTIENVRWICKRINYMKHTLSDSDFLNFVKEIYEFSFPKKILENTVKEELE